MPKTIVILTTGQPSTNPRMIKEYMSLKQEGFNVKVFYSFWQAWATRADTIFFANRDINKEDFILVGGSPFQNQWAYNISRIFQKTYKFIYSVTGLFSEFSLSRTTSYLLDAAKKYKADLYISHNAGALPAAIAGAVKYRARAGFDAEDFHRGEYKNAQSKDCRQLISIENKYLPQCDYVTVAAPLIAKAYSKLYPGQTFSTINNVFSKKFLQKPKASERNLLTLFWFSQTIGPSRGLETVVKSINLLSGFSIELVLMGTVAEGYKQTLLDLSDHKRIKFLKPVPPDEVFEISAQYDIGLSVEVPGLENRNLCLTNKIFTYLMAGNCIIFSNTKAQSDFFNAYPETGYLFEVGNEIQLANILLYCFKNRTEMKQAGQAAHFLAESILNWEIESKTWMSLVKQVLH